MDGLRAGGYTAAGQQRGQCVGIDKAYEYQVGSSGYGSVLQRETLHATCGSETRSGASRQGGYNSSASEEFIMLRYQVRDSEYGSVQMEPLCYLETEDIKARLTLWYLATVSPTVSSLK